MGLMRMLMYSITGRQAVKAEVGMFDTITVGAELPDGASTQTAFDTKDYGATCESSGSHLWVTWRSGARNGNPLTIRDFNIL